MKKLILLVCVSATATTYAQQPPENLNQATVIQNDLGNTPLHGANSVEEAQALIQAGANINAKNKLLWTPLHYAVNNNRIDLVELLIKAGADTTLKDKWRRTPGQVAYTTVMADLVVELATKQAQQKNKSSQ